jgi:dipeptidyl aminopeptidase/acylaminoacyl peptidase
MRRIPAAAAAVALLAGGPLAARPFTVDDLLHQQSLGAQAIDPSGHSLVFEQRDRYDAADGYDQHFAVSQTLGRLRVADLHGQGAARPLLAGDPRGLVLGPFSPSGARLAVFDASDHGWRLGVVTMASGAVRWFDITPQEVLRGRALQWLSDREFLVLDRPDGWPPANLRQDWQMRARLDAAWAAAARGTGAHTVLGSGAYAAVRERPPPRRLLRVAADTGATRELASGAFIDLELSPRGDKVALFAAGDDVQPRADGPVRGPAGLETERTMLSILDLAHGDRVSACPQCDLLPNLLAWSPSGRELLVFDRGDDGLWPSGRFVRIAAETGAAARLPGDLEPHATLNPVSVRAGWMGERPLVYARPRGTARWAWLRFDGGSWTDLTRALPEDAYEVLSVSPRTLTVLAGDRVVTLDDAGRARVQAERSAALAFRPFRGTPGSRLVNALPRGSWVICGPPDHRRLQWVTGAGRAASMPAPHGPGALVLASAPGDAAVVRALAATGEERLSIVSPDGGAHTVAAINTELSDTDVPQVVSVHHAAADGAPLTSWMYLPSRPTGRTPPLIVRPYLGSAYPTPPRELYMEQSFFQNLRLLTGHGYAVLVPSLPNPPDGMTDPAKNVAGRILAVMAAAEAEPALKGRFDPARAALLGWSFGGYTTMATITQTDRFRAAVEMDGISDLVMYWSALAPSRVLIPEDGYGTIGATGTVEATQPELGAPPWGDPDRYARNSPLLAADRIHTPLLLIHGALDPIAMTQSQAMYSALFRQGKDAMLVTYWGANHAVTAPGDVRDVWARTFRFLDEHLKPTTTARP